MCQEQLVIFHGIQANDNFEDTNKALSQTVELDRPNIF